MCDHNGGFLNVVELGKPSKRKSASADPQMRCFLTGENVTPVRIQSAKIKGLLGGISMGDVLIGLKQESFWSFGLQEALNASMSEVAAKTYSAALNDLIQKNSSIIAGTNVIYWFKDKVADEENPLKLLIEPREQQERNARMAAHQLLEAVRTGQRADLRGNQYYILTASGVSGRVMVRNWEEGSFEELAANIDHWFEDLSITNYAGTKAASAPSIRNVITCVLPPLKTGQKQDDWIKPLTGISQALWNTAVHGRPIPLEAVAMVLNVHRSFCLTGEFDDILSSKPKSKNVGQSVNLLHTRMALIKAFHVRREAQSGSYRMTQEVVNPAHSSPAYHCGRLLAVLSQLQQRALGDVGANIIQRFYAAASTTPGLVLGRVVRNAQFHLDKLDSSGLANWYNGRIAEIMASMPTGMPSTLTLEEQSLFALGYYQQIAQNNSDRAAARAQKEQNEDN